MKIVIDISEEDYKNILDISKSYSALNIERIIGTIENGTPLPDHHGRIIDESQVKHIVCHTERELYGDKIRYVKATDAPTIIEADRSDSE